MLAAYIIGCLALIIKPGPDLMCVLATALSHGRARAATLMAGLVLGCWLWILLLTAGVATFFTNHPAVMLAVQCVGAAYISWLAFGAWREAMATAALGGARNDGGFADAAERESPAAASGWRLVGRGVAMSMSNPLTILFFLAFLPNFAKGGAALSPTVQTFLLGTLFCALVPFIYVPIIIAADFFRSRLVASGKAMSAIKIASATMLTAVVIMLVANIVQR